MEQSTGKRGALELRPEFQSLAGLVQKMPTECQARWSTWLLSKQLRKSISWPRFLGLVRSELGVTLWSPSDVS